MPRRDTEQLQKHTLNLIKGDFEFLMDNNPEVGAAKIIRELVHALVRSIQARQEAIAQTRDIQLDIDDVINGENNVRPVEGATND